MIPKHLFISSTFTILLNVIHQTECEVFNFEPPNLKSVLFKETDLIPDKCWSMYEVNLLRNRRVLQDMIPRKIPRDLPLLVKYLKQVEKAAENLSPGINQTLLLSAMADVIGGYLQAIVIPIANEAYYAGNIEYGTVAELHKMLQRWKWQLSTNGGMWSQECDMAKIATRVTPLEISMHDKAAACQELYVNPSPTPNETDYLGSETIISETSRISVPYLDNNLVPSAMALPFRKRNLYSLMDPKGAYILVKYYTLSMRCLSGKENDVLAFNSYFHQWIISKVVPHLHDREHWYPAFGAVMRVVETIKTKGLASQNTVFVLPINDDKQDFALNPDLKLGVEGTHDNIVSNRGFLDSLKMSGASTWLIILGLCIIICIVFCCLFLLYYITKRRQRTKIFITDDSDAKSALISLFCGLKRSLSQCGSKTVSEKYNVQVARANVSWFDKCSTDIMEGPNPTPHTYSQGFTDDYKSITSESEEEFTTDRDYK